MDWIWTRRTAATDLVLVVALTLASQAEIWAPQLMPGVADVTGSRPLLAVTTLAVTLPLAMRRTAPLTVLAVVFFVLGGFFVTLLLRMAAEADRKARHAQHRIDPYTDVTITRIRWH